VSDALVEVVASQEKGVPETFFISPEGKIVDIVVGPIAGQQELDALLDRIRPP